MSRVPRPPVPFLVIGVFYAVVRAIAVWGAEIMVYKDSATYRPPAGGLPYSVLSFTGDAPRSFVVPAFYAVLPDDTTRVVAQVVISIGAWLVLATVLAVLLQTTVARYAAFISILLLSLTTQVITWDVAILSESLAISIGVLAVAAWLRLASRPTVIVAVAVVASTGAWVLMRPYQYALPVALAVVCGLWAWRRPADRKLTLGVAGGLLLIALVSLVISPRINEGYRQRDGYGVTYFTEAFGQNFFKRYLADPETAAWFRERGMPDPSGLGPPSTTPNQAVDDYQDWHPFFAQLRQRPDWQQWLDEEAQGAIIEYSLAHRGEVIGQFVDQLPRMVRSPWTAEYGPPVDVLPPPLDWLFFAGSATSLWWGDFVLWLAVVGGLGALVVARRARPSPPLLWVGGLLIGVAAALAFQVWIGSAYEFVRHAVPSTHLARVGLIILAAGLLDALLVATLPQERSDTPLASDAEPVTPLTGQPHDEQTPGMTKKIGILVVAYNAASTLHQVLDRIPPAFAERIDRVLVCDDASDDATYLVGLGYQTQTNLPLTVIRHARNLGYGGNQKAGYRWAIEHDLDIVVLLHGDGQYAPEMLPDMVAPLEADECDAVFGSRMIEPGRARQGGMPLYKYVGNRILTRAQNTLVGTDLSEWHSGYRAYSVDALRDIPFERNSDAFDFDTEIIIQLHEAGKAITEIPIPTYYGDEICHVNGLGYARDVTADSLRYRMHRMGFGTGETAFAHDDYQMKLSPDSSHGRILEWMSHRRPARVLDLGCAAGRLGEALRLEGHYVVGVDFDKPDGVGDRLDEFHQADLDAGIPAEVEGPFDVIVAADVLEHLRQPEQLLSAASQLLGPRGVLLASVPNFAHWYPRARVLAGRFDYDRRGILDRGHLRFFTRRSFERLVESAGYRVRRRTATGLPLEVAERGARPEPGGRSSRLGDTARSLDRAAVTVWPTLFGYQFLYELEPA